MHEIIGHTARPGNNPLLKDLFGMSITEKHLVDALFTYASIGVLVVNRQGLIILANPFLLDEFGYNEEELIGMPVEKLIPLRFHKKHQQHREKFNGHLQNRPMGVGMDLFAQRRDRSEFPVEVSLCHYSNEQGNFVIAFVNNISIRKKADEEIKRLNDDLEHMVESRTQQLKEALHRLEQSREEISRALNKEKELNELKSKFVSIASHEFRTPLSTILSSTFLLEKYTSSEEQPKRKKHIDRIVSSVNTLTDILNDFLSVGKIEEGKVTIRYTRFQIDEFIQNITEEMRALLKTGQIISYQHTGPVEIRSDRNLLKHIIFNLVSNAIKFSKEGGEIKVISETNTDHFKVWVKDNGLGISDADQEHLFERFFRGSNVTNIQGTGLGLHIVGRYSELLNGHIACKSQLNEGTEMSVMLPNKPENSVEANTPE